MRSVLAILALSGGCAGIPSPPEHPEISERAFRQQAEADLSLTFTSWEDIDAYPWRDDIPWKRDLSRDEFIRYLREIPIGRSLCVVIFAKNAVRGIGMDDIEAMLREEGFRRVIFQQHVGKRMDEGRPILRE